MTLYCDVAIATPPYQTFTYSFDNTNNLNIVGYAVKVPFGKKNTLGWVWRVHKISSLRQTKKILSIESNQALFTEDQLALLSWMSDYYLCLPGLVCLAALPSNDLVGVKKLRKDTFIKGDLETIQKFQPSKSAKSLLKLIQDLDQYPEFCDQKDRMKRCGVNSNIIKKATSLGLIQHQDRPSWQREIQSIGVTPNEATAFQLSAEQSVVIQDLIKDDFLSRFRTHVINGVTGSGKTFIYLQLAKLAIEVNRTVLMIVPEISMTPQLIGYFQQSFSDRVRILHSRITENAKIGTYSDLRNGFTGIVIGARSAVFAPMTNLGLVIVDEEHESSLKQNDPEPRYHARDCAIIRAKIANCPVILGSATPSVESLYNCSIDKYSQHFLKNRVFKTPLPEIKIIDMSVEKMREKGRTEVLSEQLRIAIQDRLNKNEQVILLRNRRGYGTHIRCGKCNWIKLCPNCSVTLTFHQSETRLLCHLCGHLEEMLERCEQCGSAQIAPRGFGTERVIELLQIDFPNARILRFDYDSVKQKNSHQQILTSFGNHEADILVGTKMVARGLDFPKVTLSGILVADSEWIIPDFRSEERALSLFIQTAGRSGRSKQGEVIIQTWNPNHPIFTYLLNHNWEGYVESVLKLRKRLVFPPFSRLIRIIFSSMNEECVRQTTEGTRENLSINGFDCSEVSQALISKRENWFRYSFLIRIRNLSEKKELISFLPKQTKDLKISTDVDPFDFS